MILVIDNYDSFTYNLVHLIGKVTQEITVKRNDQITIEGIRGMKPERILISPGPGRPEEAGISVEIIKTLGPTIPVLGVCLGHQAIGYAFGGKIVHAPKLVHGKTSPITHDGKFLFTDLPNPFTATRYHSLVIAPESLSSDLEMTAWTSDKIIMGVRHKTHPIQGVQFHPESILTEAGETLIRNWLKS